MAEVIIEDGTGKGNKQKVDNTFRSHVQSLSIPYEDFAVLNGDSFGIPISKVSLTTDTVSYLLYLKNTNGVPFVIRTFQFDFATSDALGTDWEFILQLNPTGGTLLTAGAPSPVINNNLGSSKILDSLTLSGAQGDTATGGIPVPFLVQGPGTVFRNQPAVVLPPGASLAIGLIPPTGNTSVLASIGLTVIKLTLDL